VFVLFDPTDVNLVRTSSDYFLLSAYEPTVVCVDLLVERECLFSMTHMSRCLVIVDEQTNRYQPTYTFPKAFDGNLELVEDYIRKAASENVNDDDYRRNVRLWTRRFDSCAMCSL
jgi:hypothetical protein